MGKHAYLVMAHKCDYTFHTLLHLLDDERNTIFIHMDEKTSDYSPSETTKQIHKARIIHTPKRVNVHWGGFSQIQAELELLETATTHGPFDFYHLLSGEDLPIKTQDYIHNFFDENKDKVFVHMFDSAFDKWDRIQYYHTFQELLQRDNTIQDLLNSVYIKLQKICNIKRNQNIEFQYGSQWFSIPHSFANYVLSRRDWINATFKNTTCSDEIFLQTLVINSEFKNDLYSPEHRSSKASNQRYLDWSRGNGSSPWDFRISDAEALHNTDLLYARKFNCKIDKDIIDYVATHLAVN